MMCYYLELGRAFDWLEQSSHVTRQIRSTIQFWVITLLRGETSGGVGKCRLFNFLRLLKQPSPGLWAPVITFLLAVVAIVLSARHSNEKSSYWKSYVFA